VLAHGEGDPARRKKRGKKRKKGEKEKPRGYDPAVCLYPKKGASVIFFRRDLVRTCDQTARGERRERKKEGEKGGKKKKKKKD